MRTFITYHILCIQCIHMYPPSQFVPKGIPLKALLIHISSLHGGTNLGYFPKGTHIFHLNCFAAIPNWCKILYTKYVEATFLAPHVHDDLLGKHLGTQGMWVDVVKHGILYDHCLLSEEDIFKTWSISSTILWMHYRLIPPRRGSATYYPLETTRGRQNLQISWLSWFLPYKKIHLLFSSFLGNLNSRVQGFIFAHFPRSSPVDMVPTQMASPTSPAREEAHPHPATPVLARFL